MAERAAIYKFKILKMAPGRLYSKMAVGAVTLNYVRFKIRARVAILKHGGRCGKLKNLNIWKWRPDGHIEKWR